MTERTITIMRGKEDELDALFKAALEDPSVTSIKLEVQNGCVLTSPVSIGDILFPIDMVEPPRGPSYLAHDPTKRHSRHRKGHRR